MSTEPKRDGGIPARKPLTLAPHRTLALDEHSLAVLAERSTGWCIVTREDYETIRRYFTARPSTYGGAAPGARPVLEMLWSAGLLLAGRQAHPDTVVEQERYPNSLLLKLTGACNFECTYCYDYDRERWKARLQPDRVRETVAFLLSKIERLSLVFHGGEPLLRFALMKRIVTEAIEVAGDRSRLSFAMQTNGSLFNDEVVSFLEEHNFSVGISLDGFNEQSNGLRVLHDGRGSTEGVMRLLGRYSDFVRHRCGFLAVVSRTSAPHLPDFALWLQAQRISGLTVSFLDLVGRGQDMAREKLTPEEAVELYRTLISMVRRREIDALALRSLISRIHNLFTFQPRDFCHKGPCAAAGDFLVLDAEGGFRSCDCIYDPYFELAGRDEPVEKIVDHPQRLAIIERHSWLRERGADCQSCALFGLCGGTCVAKAIAARGTPQSVDPIECALVRYIYPELLREFNSDGEKPLFAYYQRHKGAATAPVPV